MLSNKTPQVSVIMPAYNASAYIREAINGVLNQTFTDFEFIIADDGSTDDTKAIIASYNDPRVIASHNAVNQGKTKTVNRLFKEAKGEFVTVHDADDVSHPDRFRMQVDAMLRDPN